MRFYGLDLETAPAEGNDQVFALQPWRALTEEARVTCLSAVTEGKPVLARTYREFNAVLQPLACCGSAVATWNGVFDIAWLIASGFEKYVEGISWIDSMLLWKWVDNGQRKEFFDPNWSLVDGAERWLRDLPWCPAFLRLKACEPPAGQHDDYWVVRAKYDALAAKIIAERAWAALTPQQRRGALIEAECLVPVAKSWVRGIEMDVPLAASMEPAITQEMEEIETRLGVRIHTSMPWQPSPVLRSPKQLAVTLYDKWRLPCTRRTPKGEPSTDKTALTYLADTSDFALEILRWRELNTQFTKFIHGIHKAYDYLGSHVSHPGPRLFSTYTGRMTYSTKSSGKGVGAKAKVGVPIHQWPRPKELRRLIKAPQGKAIVEFDAAGQEARFIAQLSQDPAMLQILNSDPPFDDLHSYMGSKLCGMSFESFLKAKERETPAIVGPKGYRMQGKFTNLSNQYRIGAKSLRIKARVDYGMSVDIRTAMLWRDTYTRTYPGVKRYWSDAIYRAREAGYAESLAGRRFALEFWGQDKEWTTGQSAINHPIQASGGDQKELALSTLSQKFPELEFFMDLHDGLYFYSDIGPQLPELIAEAKHHLDNLDYGAAWDWSPSVPMPWDASVGLNWGQKRDFKPKVKKYA